LREEFPARVRLAAWNRERGHCQECGSKITRGVEYDHIVPTAIGGPPTEANCAVLCSPCHSLKTTKTDVPAIAKTRRVIAKVAKAERRKRPMAGSKASGWRKRMDGTVERRG